MNPPKPGMIRSSHGTVGRMYLLHLGRQLKSGWLNEYRRDLTLDDKPIRLSGAG